MRNRLVAFGVKSVLGRAVIAEKLATLQYRGQSGFIRMKSNPRVSASIQPQDRLFRKSKQQIRLRILNRSNLFQGARFVENFYRISSEIAHTFARALI